MNSIAQVPDTGIVVLPDNLLFQHRDLIIVLAAAASPTDGLSLSFLCHGRRSHVLRH
jgi:hypothetical protein